MPTAADRLGRDASDEEIANAISSCIAQMMREKRGDPDWPRKRIIRACYEMARTATGKQIRGGGE